MKKKVLFSFIALGVVFALFGSGIVLAENSEIELSFMHYYTTADEGAYSITFNKVLDEYIESHNEYKINEEVLSHDNYEMKIKTLAAANELPDVFLVKGSMVDTFKESGLIKSFEPILADNQEWKNSFIDGAFEDFKREGDIYGIPLSVGATSLVFYNQEIFEEAGVNEFPETWEGFKTAVTKIKEAGYTPISLGNKGKWVAESCILSMLGDRYTGTDWFRSIRDRKGASFTDQEFVSALDAMQTLAEMKAFNMDMNSIDNYQQKTAYYNKEAAMFFEGAWAVNVVETNAPQDIVKNTKITILPEVKSGKGDANTLAGGAGWAYQINPNLEGEEREAAIDLIKNLTNQEFSTRLIENNGRPATQPENYDKSKVSDLMNEYFALIEKSKFTPTYDVQLSPSVIEVMNSGLQELLIEVTTPEELAARIQNEYENK